MLVYFPATPTNLREFAHEGSTVVENGWAVTEALRALDASLHDDDWQYHVLYSAADYSVQMSGNDGRRIVVAADIDQAAAVDDPGPGQVRINTLIDLETVDAFYLDVAAF